MKIILAALNAKYVHSNLAVHALEAYVNNRKDDKLKNAELCVREFTINHNLDMILQSLYREKADIIAFSCYIWNIREILSIANELKKISCGIRIWLGGPEVSYDSRKLMNEYPFIDVIMRGEGEVTLCELIKAEAHTTYDGIRGITYRNSCGDICENEERSPMSLDEAPFIYNDLSKFDNRILCYETSRGCPFSCSYCLSSIDKSVRFRSMDLVKKELSFFLDNNVRQVKFIDRTFNCNRKHALAIWRYIAEHDNGITNFHFEVSLDLIEEEELDLFSRMRPGLIQLEIGLQSTNPDTLKEIRRVTNIEKIRGNMCRIASLNNIHTHLDLIAGLPYEDFASFKKSFNDAYDMKPNQLQLGFLKVLKGSYMEEMAPYYGLRYQDCQPYEVLGTKWISYDEILKLKQAEEMVEVYYNSSQFEHVLSYLIPHFESPYRFYELLGEYYYNNSLFGIGFRRESRYEALRCFASEHLANVDDFSAEIFESLLTYDYYLRENAKRRPPWTKEQPVKTPKATSRMMHIEPLVSEIVPLIRGSCDRQEAVVNGKYIYCLFDYEKKDPVSGNFHTKLLTYEK